jgi:alpha-mannosidase
VRSWRLWLLVVASGLLSATHDGAAQAHDPSGKQITPPTSEQVLYYIPHTHWEGAVFKTREEYLEMGLPHILQALALLKRYPDYKFTLDQVAYIRPFLERYPEEAATFRKFVAAGRLEIVGGMDVMPDVVKPGGELFVRQMQYGKRYCREQLGVDVTVAWLLDTFGHHPQLPQLLKLAGYKSFWFCRGVPNNNLPSEFLWRGIDGTDLPAFWLPGFYGLFYGPPQQPDAFAKFFAERYATLDSHVHGAERVGLAGVDVSEPEAYVPPLIAQYNRQPTTPFKIRYSVPSEFATVVARRPNLPVIAGDFSPIFQGTYSSRIELKQTTREIEQRLLTAEKLTALANWLGAETDGKALWQAWEPTLFNQTHDLASGVMTDHVYEDVRRGYDFSKRMADEISAARWDNIAAHIDTRGAGIPVVVFNTLGWPRTDVAEVEVGFAAPGVPDVDVIAPSGNAIPVEILRSDRYGDGGLLRATLRFVARDIPALGYATYRVVPKQATHELRTAQPAAKPDNVIENETYRVTLDLASGAITSLFDKTLQWEALAGPANIVARQEDKGDLWELYHGLDGASFIAMTNRQPVPTPSTAQLSNAFTAQNGSIHKGPVYSEFSVTHPFASGTYETHVRLYAGINRVDITTELVNNEKFVRYQALFPTSIKNGRNVQEIPFGAVERPVGIEYPAQQWVDYSDGQHGVALLNVGLPGNLVTDGTLMLSLLRSHSIGGYGFGGGYEPGMTSESGFELGRPLTFHYALVPHRGTWQQTAAYRAGLEFNHPLLVHKVAPHAGELPKRWGLIEISQPNVVLTAFKPGPGKTAVLRVYEAEGKATPNVQIKLHARIIAAHEANLLEDTGHRLNVQSDTVQFDLHPFEIKTIKLNLAPAKTTRARTATPNTP